MQKANRNDVASHFLTRIHAMRALIVLVLLAVWAEAVPSRNGSRYGFYRGMVDESWGDPIRDMFTRRVFGGEAAELSAFPAACALLDRYYTERCSGSVLTARWVLTAAHCVTPHVSYIKYNARRPTPAQGDVAAILYLYRHPEYKVVQEDEGRGIDVTRLCHDIGLVRTRRDMKLIGHTPTDPIHAMHLFNPLQLQNEEVEVFGFGRTERSSMGEELFRTKLQMVFCERMSWYHCMCGVAAGRDPRGVCAGDSGGPVLYRGVQVAVTSMGPIECSVRQRRAALMPSEKATSVFTTLYNYVGLINQTIHSTDAAMHMDRIASASDSCRLRVASAALASLMLAIMF